MKGQSGIFEFLSTPAGLLMLGFIIAIFVAIVLQSFGLKSDVIVDFFTGIVPK